MNINEYDNSFIAEALPAFISEANEQIESLEHLLLQLEDTPDDRELLDALFRCAHTVKGSAGIFGLDQVVTFTHHVETLLDRLREGQLALTPELSTLLLQSNDQIRALVAAAQNPQADTAEAKEAREQIVQRLKTASGELQATDSSAPAAHTPAKQDEQARRWHVAVRFGSETFRNGMDPLALLDYVRGLGSMAFLACDTGAVPALDALDPENCHLAFEFSLDTQATREEIESAFSFVRDDCSLQLTEPGAKPQQAKAEVSPGVGRGVGPDVSREASPKAVDAAPQKQQQKRREGTANPSPGDDSRFIRVHADRLDEVINLLGELVIAGAGASLLARQSRQGALIEANQQITGLIEEIRNGTLQLRMVPIGETFARFRRVVRDTAAELGKDVQLDIVGGETELDKSVVEHIADPLMHLVRNALDHGLETAAERVASNKPAQGKLTLSACHESGGILIRIDDNGRGIQRDKVLQRAWERGLVPQGVVPSDADIFKLIFEAGFSTAEKVTNLSGRGVGMDVVRRNIEALRGSVSISSQAGQGSTIEIRLPLTLAVIDGFLISVGPSKFIFPLDSVVEVIENHPSSAAVDKRGRRCVELRGQVLPVVSLRALYALDSPEPERSSVVVVSSGESRYGVMVDALLGQQQTVIKPLARMFRSLRGVSGSSILGTGEVALIFDVNSLSQLAAQEPHSTSGTPRHTGAPSQATTTSPEGIPS